MDVIIQSLNEIEKAVSSGNINPPPVQYRNDVDTRLANKIPKIKILGIGGAGNNTVTNLMLSKVSHAEIIAVNTDAKQLLASKAHKKILIGEETCGGFGAGSDPRVGEAAALESREILEKTIKGTDLLFLTCGLGGGTGSGATPVIAKLAQEMGVLTVTVCTLPFSAEGFKKMEIAAQALKKLIPVSNTIVIIPNDKLLQIDPKATLLKAFAMADDILVKAVIGIVDLVTKTGKVNVDFADVRKVLNYGGTAVIGIGEADGSSTNRAELAITKALTNPLIDARFETAKAALVNITGGEDITLEETATIIGLLGGLIDKKAEIKWGAFIDDDLRGKLRVTVMMAGIELPYLDNEGNLIYPAILRRGNQIKLREKIKEILGANAEYLE